MEPRCKNEELWKVAIACAGFMVLAIAGLVVIGNIFNVSTAAGGTGAVANIVGIWMALVGVVVIGFGLFYAGSELTVPKAPASEGEGLESVPPGVVKEIAEALKSLKGAAAVLFAGPVLVAMSGVVAWQTAEAGNGDSAQVTQTTRSRDRTGGTAPEG
ncbi:MAG: hypothetical protein ACRDWA_07520 [Acidimicrobiia bacterium]